LPDVAALRSAWLPISLGSPSLPSCARVRFVTAGGLLAVVSGIEPVMSVDDGSGGGLNSDYTVPAPGGASRL
jgi:hypothetical protein